MTATESVPTGRDPRPSEATRYLCAAAYLDHHFADSALERTIYEKHRAIAASPGVDIVPILRHCVAARRRRTVRDALLALFLSLMVFAFINLELRLLILAGLFSWFVVMIELATARYNTVGRRLGPGAIEIDSPAISNRASELIDEAGARENGNLSVYSGFSPFVGSGLEVGGWSFALNVRKGRELLTGGRAVPKEFSISEFYDAIGEQLSGLAIEGLSLQERLHVHGQDVRPLGNLLPDAKSRPVSSVSEDVVRLYRDNSSNIVRHYLCLRVEDWRGELVLSMFFRLRLVSETLFMETSFFLLPPLIERRHHVDSLQSLPTVKEVAGLALRSFTQTISGLVLAYPRLISRAFEPVNRLAREHADQLLISSDAAFDYGALPTMREWNTSSNYRRYFQKLDKEMYAKTVERTLFDVIASFLDEHDIDTTAFDERRSTVLNNGVMVTGGSFSAENVAAGARSRASSEMTSSKHDQQSNS